MTDDNPVVRQNCIADLPIRLLANRREVPIYAPLVAFPPPWRSAKNAVHLLPRRISDRACRTSSPGGPFLFRDRYSFTAPVIEDT
jgi:hypothetical protein